MTWCEVVVLLTGAGEVTNEASDSDDEQEPEDDIGDEAGIGGVRGALGMMPVI